MNKTYKSQNSATINFQVKEVYGFQKKKKKTEQIVSSTLKDTLVHLCKAGRKCISYSNLDKLEGWDAKNSVNKK